MQIIPYDKHLVILNTEMLPRGRGCRFLECMTSHAGALIACRWRRQPATSAPDHVLVCFVCSSESEN